MEDCKLAAPSDVEILTVSHSNSQKKFRSKITNSILKTNRNYVRCPVKYCHNIVDTKTDILSKCKFCETMICQSCVALNKEFMCCTKKKDISEVIESETRNTELISKPQNKCCVGPAYHVCPICHQLTNKNGNEVLVYCT